MSAEILREFLIPVKYHVDGAAEARFTSSMRGAVLQANLLATAIEAAIKGFGEIFSKVATSLNDLFYASQRTRASVENIKAFGYAASQLGSSVSDANSSLESFGKFLRANPGGYGVLKALGIDASNMKDSGRLLEELGVKLRAMRPEMQIAYGNMFGLSDKTLQAIIDPKFKEYAEERRRILRMMGVDAQKAAADGAKLTQSWNRIAAITEGIANKIVSVIIKDYGGAIEKFGKYLIDNGDRIADIVAKIAKAIGDMLKWLIEFLPKADDFVQKIGGWNVALTALAAVIVASVLPGLTRLSAALIGLVAIRLPAWLLGVLGGAAGLSGGAAVAAGAAAVAAVGGAGYLVNDATRDQSGKGIFQRAWGWTKEKLGIGGAPGGEAGAAGGGPQSAPFNSGGKTFSEKAPSIMQRLMNEFGLSKAQAAGIVGNLGHESSGFRQMQEVSPLIPRSRGGWGWAQWTGSRRKEFEAWAKERGLDPRSDEANYGFLAHELRTSHKGALESVKRQTTATGAMQAFELGFERSGVKAWGSRQKWTDRALAAFDRPAPAAPQSPTLPPMLDQWAKRAGSPADAASAPFGGLPDRKMFDTPLAPANTSWNRTTNNNLSQKVEITVNGANDAVRAGSEIGRAVESTNRRMADTVRNFSDASN